MPKTRLIGKWACRTPSFLALPNQGTQYRWMEHSVLPITTGGGLLMLIMIHKLNQSF